MLKPQGAILGFHGWKNFEKGEVRRLKHTPGPWSYRENPEPNGKWDWWVDNAHDRKTNGMPIANVFTYHEGEANARLIAAAPDLYKAVKDAVYEKFYYEGVSADTIAEFKNIIERIENH